MKRCAHNRLAWGIILATLPLTAPATTGYFQHGYGVKSRGVAGAGVALPQDAMDAAINPANMVFVGNDQQLGIGIFAPTRKYTVSGQPSGAPGTFGLFPGTVKSENEAFLIPNYARNWMLNEDSSIGLTVYANGGMNTEWKDTDVDPFGFGTYGGGTAGVDYSQLFASTTYARKFAPAAAWGVSGILAVQSFKAEGLSQFANVSNDPENLTNNGHEQAFGAGLKFGVSGEVTPKVSLGASVQSEIKMQEFDDYAGLFADKGDMSVPPSATIGLAFKPTTASALLFDVQRIWYSEIDAIGNPMFPAFGICAMRTTPTSPSCLGGSDGIGFGWEDVTVYRLGYQWGTANDWTWRAGFATFDQPIPESEVLFNILATGVPEDHITFGFSKGLKGGSAIDVSFMYAPNVKVRGPNPLEAPGAQEIEIEMKQYSATVNWSKTF